MIESSIPVKKNCWTLKMIKIPAITATLNKISEILNRCLFIKGSKTAVNKANDEKQLTATDTLLALIAA